MNLNQLPEAAKEIARQATAVAEETAHRATDTAKDIYQSAALKAEDTLAASKEYVRQNPVLVVVGALAFGAAIGCMLMMSRRQPAFRERYMNEPLDSAREAILAALAPVAQRLHEGYDLALDGAGKAMDRVHRFNLSHWRGRRDRRHPKSPGLVLTPELSRGT